VIAHGRKGQWRLYEPGGTEESPESSATDRRAFLILPSEEVKRKNIVLREALGHLMDVSFGGNEAPALRSSK
jgi:hypothetical protein